MEILDLSLNNRLLLAQAACVAAWSDTSVAPEERDIVLSLCAALELPDELVDRVRAWLVAGVPDLDPHAIERRHRDVFLDVVQQVFEADGRIDPMESETYKLLHELLS